jgi:hypothetical protein
MNPSINEALWSQFGASIKALENTISACPTKLWNTEKLFWYKAYHCLFWTDYYLTTSPASFKPPAPFTLSEFDGTSQKMNPCYNKVQLLDYLSYCKQKAESLITALTTETLDSRWVNEYKNFSLLEILLYNMRHIQHHAAQLNMLLKQETGEATPWVSRAT